MGAFNKHLCSLTWESNFACFPADAVEVGGVLLHRNFRGTGRELLLRFGSDLRHHVSHRMVWVRGPYLVPELPRDVFLRSLEEALSEVQLWCAGVCFTGEGSCAELSSV